MSVLLAGAAQEVIDLADPDTERRNGAPKAARGNRQTAKPATAPVKAPVVAKAAPVVAKAAPVAATAAPVAAKAAVVVKAPAARVATGPRGRVTPRPPEEDEAAATARKRNEKLLEDHRDVLEWYSSQAPEFCSSLNLLRATKCREEPTHDTVAWASICDALESHLRWTAL